MGPEKGKGQDSTRLRVCITSVRGRLIDADNLCPKYFIDCLRYAEIIKEDSPEFITLEVSQRKVNPGEAERTIIEVYSMPESLPGGRGPGP